MRTERAKCGWIVLQRVKEQSIHPPPSRAGQRCRGARQHIMSQISLFVPPSCAACASQECAGAHDPAACPLVVVVTAHLVRNAPATGEVGPIARPIVVPVQRAILGAVIMRLANLGPDETEGGRLPRATCPACGRGVCLGAVGLASLARVPARLAPPRLARARAGLWCPICGRPVLSGKISASAPDVAAILRKWLARNSV